MKEPYLVSIAVSNDVVIDIETTLDHGPPVVYMSLQVTGEKPYSVALNARDMGAIHYVLGEWLYWNGREGQQSTEDEAKRQFDQGNYSYLALDMKDEGIELDHLTRVARLIRKYR